MAEIAAAVLVASGIATRYAPQVMDVVVANREMYFQIDTSIEVRGYVALLEREHLGRIVWLESPDGAVVGPVMVADCASEHDRDRLAALGWAVDLSWELAQELGVIDAPMAGFKVWDADPRISEELLDAVR